MPPEEVKKPVPEVPDPQPEPTPDPAPEDVLPPETEPTPTPEPAPEPEPTAEDLRGQLAAKQAEIDQLKAGQPVAEPTPLAAPGQRVSMAQVFISTVIPQAKKLYAEATEPARQFEIMAETANQLVGAVMADQITPAIQQLAAANVELMNEIEILNLRSDPEFKDSEAAVREQLKKTDWKTRAGNAAATDIFHKLRGSKKNGTVRPVTPAVATSATRAALKDLAAGGGASPKPSGVRLTVEQEKDFQAMLETGWPGSRSDYYSKWKSRADQAKAQGKKIPQTYRG